MKKRLLLYAFLALLACALVWFFTGDAKQRSRTVKMLTSIKVGQVVELMSGIGELGILNDGSGAKTMRLPEGIEVEVFRGKQPLVRKPLPPLPMEDHPYMLDEYGSGGVHTDSYNSSVSPLPGPLGIKPKVKAVTVLEDEIAMCTPLMRDLKDRLASVCISLGGPSQLVLFDPKQDFKIVAQTEIPKRRSLIDPAGGWYSRMDHLGRPVVPTPAQDIRVYEVVEKDGEFAWHITKRYDLSKHLPKDVSASDVVPDWSNNYWFISGFGHVGYLTQKTKHVEVIELGQGDETIGAALTVSRAGAYVLTSKALYMLSADPSGKPYVRWRWDYGEAGGVDLSTPTLMDQGRLVAFSIDGAEDRSLLMVVKTSTASMSEKERVVCRFGMFKPGKSSIKNTVMAYGRSIVAENNFGADFFEVMDYEPGLARVDVREDHSGCDLVWEDYTVASQVPPRLSTGDGHIYLYSRKRGTPENVHAWYLSAIDFETGKVVSEIFLGSGKRIDNPMLSSDFWPGGVYVAGVRNGILTMRDGD